jgi:tetratricopeptide (TPR) repeat protein
MLDLTLSEILEDPTSTLDCLSNSQKEAYLFSLFHELKLELERGCGEEERVARGILFLLLLSPANPDLFFDGVSLLNSQGIQTNESFWFSYAVDAVRIYPKEQRTEKLTTLLVTALYMRGVLENEPSFIFEALEESKNTQVLSLELKWMLAKCWIYLGRISGEQSDFIKGLNLFKSIRLHIAPSMIHSLHFDIALALIDLGRAQGDLKPLKEAQDLLKPLVAHYSLHESSPKAHARKAWHLIVEAALETYRLKGCSAAFDEADHFIREALLALPNQKSFWLNWGELYLQRGLWTESLSDIEVALEKLSAEGLRPTFEKPLFHLCCPALALMGLYSNNFAMIQTALDQLTIVLEDDFSKETYRTLLWVQWIQAFFLNDPLKFEEVERDLINWTEHNGESSREFYLLWKLYDREDLSASHALLKRLIHRSPHHALFRLHLGKLLHKVRASVTREEDHQALLEEAAFQFEKAFKEGGEYEPLVCLGTTYDQLGLILKEEHFFHSALTKFDEAFDLETPDFESLFLFARTLVHYGDVCNIEPPLTRGINLLEQLTKLDHTKNPDLYLLLGYSLLLKASRVKEPPLPLLYEAEKALTVAQEEGKNEALYFLACCYAQMGKQRKALRFVLKSLERGTLDSYEVICDDPWLSPFADSPWFDLGYSLADVDIY